MNQPAQNPLSHKDRHVRMQLLVMRASYERLDLQNSLGGLARQLQPGALLAQARSSLLDSRGLGWLGATLQAARRYPTVLSIAATLLATPTRRRLALKFGLIGGLVWLGLRAKQAENRPESQP